MTTLTIERTENKNVAKFVANYQLIPGSIELSREDNTSEIPMAEEVFKFPFVEKIFITSNFIAIAKNDVVDWETIEESLKNVLLDELLANPRIYAPKTKMAYQIYAEMTPNPAVMKFVSTKGLLDGFVEVKSKEDAADVPLAKALYDEFDFVEEVFISDQFVAVTKSNAVHWHEVMIAVRSFIAEYLQIGNEITKKPAQKHEKPVEAIINREYTETEEKISSILNEYVAPAVENDGGKISLLEYDSTSKTAKMLLQGACSGCPSSTATLKNGVENILKQFLPDLVENVEAING